MKLWFMLVVAALFLTGCGHKDYDGFMNGSVSGQWGILILVTVTSAAFLIQKVRVNGNQVS